jgi:hypothetical protein
MRANEAPSTWPSRNAQFDTASVDAPSRETAEMATSPFAIAGAVGVAPQPSTCG